MSQTVASQPIPNAPVATNSTTVPGIAGAMGMCSVEELSLNPPTSIKQAVRTEHQDQNNAYRLYSILAHPVVSVFCQLSPKQQKYQNFPYKKAVQKWLR